MSRCSSRRLGFGQYIVALGAAVLIAAAPAGPGYMNDFEKAAVGVPPPDVTLLDGDFIVQELNGNKVLQLPGDPLKDFGFLFGPDQLKSADIGGQIFSGVSGRRKPEFGIGAGGVGGYRLWIWPSESVAELRKGDAAVASARFDWRPDAWTHLRLRIRQPSPGQWRIEAKAWPEGTTEPDAWLLGIDTKEAPPAGRASAWGIPYASKPILFDNLRVAPAD